MELGACLMAFLPASMLKAFLFSFFGLCSSVLIIFLSIRLSIDLFVLLSFSISKIDQYVDYVARSRSLSSWSEGERALGVVIPTRFPCISYSHRSILSSTRVSYSLIFALFFLFVCIFNRTTGTQNFIALKSLPFLSQPIQSIKGRSGVNMASFYDELEEIAGYGEEPPYEEDQRDTEVRGPEAHVYALMNTYKLKKFFDRRAGTFRRYAKRLFYYGSHVQFSGSERLSMF